jgi:hypothetical protein
LEDDINVDKQVDSEEVSIYVAQIIEQWHVLVDRYSIKGEEFIYWLRDHKLLVKKFSLHFVDDDDNNNYVSGVSLCL